MNHNDLESWAIRAVQELQDYADSAEEAGCSEPGTLALISEFDAIFAGRPPWQTQVSASTEREELTL